jgi:hypothetical protein
MSEVRIVLLLAAGIGLPAGYVAVCAWLHSQRAWWFLYLAYFALFGTLGGWAIAIATSPSGIAAACAVFLATVAPTACLVSAIVVSCRRKKGRADWVALTGGYLYPAGMLVSMGLAFLFDLKSR